MVTDAETKQYLKIVTLPGYNLEYLLEGIHLYPNIIMCSDKLFMSPLQFWSSLSILES